MEPGKISFGFSKLIKKINIISNVKPEEKKVDLIDCLEGQSIKIKDAVEIVDEPLVIPLRDNKKNLLDRVMDAKNRSKPDSSGNDVEDTQPELELTPDELIARQVLQDARERLANGSSSNNSKISVLPISEQALSLEGEKEPTLEDYESVPISDYGLALLRGMGWKEGIAIGKNTSKSAMLSLPELRPKGLGLGATRVLQSEVPTKKAVDKDGRELMLVKGAFGKVIAGAHKGNYCEVQGFDDDGRVVVKVYPQCEIVNLNEFLLVPVTKEEFSKGSKVINNAKYEQYKEISDKNLDSYRIKVESSNARIVEKEEVLTSDSDDDRKSSSRKYEEIRIMEKSSTHKEGGESPNRYRESKDFRKKQNKKHRRSRSKSREGNKQYSSSTSKKNYNSTDESSDDEKYGNKITSKNKQGTSKHYSSDEDKRSKKHSKSKNRSKSMDKPKKDRSYRDPSESDSDHKRDKRKRNKCKSRHKRNSSSSSEDRRYKGKR